MTVFQVVEAIGHKVVPVFEGANLMAVLETLKTFGTIESIVLTRFEHGGNRLYDVSVNMPDNSLAVYSVTL